MPEPPEGSAGAATRGDGAWLLRRAMEQVVGGAIDAALSARGGSREILVADIGGRSSPWRARVESVARRAGRPIRHVSVDLDPRATVRGVAEALPLRAGSADRRAPIDDARRITRTLSRARIVAIEGADHEEMMARSFEHIAEMDALLRDAVARRATR